MNNTKLSTVAALALVPLSAMMPLSASYAVANTTVVAKSGGDYTDPVTAMNDRLQWCPSTATRCTMKIEAGTFDIGATPIYMLPHITIQGAGENATILKATGGSVAVHMASWTTLHDLTIDMDGMTGSEVTGIHAQSNTTPEIRDVRVALRGGGFNHTAGITTDSSSARMENVTVISTGSGTNIGILSDGGNNTLRNLSVRMSGGGTNVGLENHGGNDPHRVFDSQITVTGGSTNEGIRVVSGRTYGFNSTIDVYGGTTAYGISQIDNWGGYWLRFNHMVVEAYNATNAYAVKIHDGDNGATFNNSYLRGSDASLSQGPTTQFTMHLHQTRLHSTPAIERIGNPSIVCTAVTAGNTDFYADTCP